jgi:hypothetical protein
VIYFKFSEFYKGNKKPDGLSTTGLSKPIRVAKLNRTQHDRGNEGKGQIRRQYAQPVDESHGNAPLVYVTCPH